MKLNKNQSIIATVCGTILAGILFIISSIHVLYDSEINHLEYKATVENVVAKIISVNSDQEPVLEKINNQTVYVKGGLSTKEMLQDKAFGIQFPDALIVEKKLYVYLTLTQEVDKEIIDDNGNLTTVKREEKTNAWVESEPPKGDAIRSGSYENQLRGFLPKELISAGRYGAKEFRSDLTFAKTLHMGKYNFDQALTVKAIDELKQKIRPYSITKEALPTSLRNVSVIDGTTLYIRSSLFKQDYPAPLTLNDCQEPQVGDIKVMWKIVPKGEVFSVLAKMTDKGLSSHVTIDSKKLDTINVVYKWLQEMEYRPDLTTISMGSKSIEELIELNKEQNNSHILSRHWIPWLMLGGGFFTLFMIPSSILAILPFTGFLVDANRAIAFILAVPLAGIVGLITIAFAWCTDSLMYGMIGLFIAVILLYFVLKLLKRK